jgi:RHS repeat-associated protein
MKTKIFYLFLLFPFIILAQSNDHNWVKQTIYKIETPNTMATPASHEAQINLTYLDGVGRPMQQNAYRQAGDTIAKDIITHIEYDGFGRQVINYLPVSIPTNTMAFVDPTDIIGTHMNAEYNGQPAYSEKKYDDSPLNRILEISAPGTKWNMNSSQTIKMQYQTNIASDNVINYTTSNDQLIDSGMYQINTLYKNTVTDENGNPAQEFKNSKGQLVLKRNFLNGNNLDTYYIYDQFENLAFVVPPKAPDNQQDTIDNLCYQYRYDNKNRLIAKKIPGKQWEFIVYDALNRIVATGPAYNPFGGDDTVLWWLYSRYDQLNRLVMTGWFPSDLEAEETYSGDNFASREVLQSNYGNDVINAAWTDQPNNVDGLNVNYTTDNLPPDFKILTVNYYDSYNFPTPIPIDFTTPYLNVYYNNAALKPTGLPTGSWVRTLISETGPITGETSYILYDYRGQPVVSHKFNFLGGFTRTISELDFNGKAIKTTTTHRGFDDATTPLVIEQEFKYTDQGFLEQHKHQVNNDGWKILSNNQYSALGRLKVKKTGVNTANHYLQNINYDYNIRGWLTGINKVGDLDELNGENDLFAFQINYDIVDGNVPNATAYYNGNISETYWRTAADNTIRKYSYQYDTLNRLLDAVYQKPDANSPIRNSYNEHIRYDENGNIIHLTRKGNLDVDGTEIEIDNLLYVYENNKSNKLIRISDGTNSGIGFKDDPLPTISEYTYDKNGNMIKDRNKDITVTYNHLNLPTEIIFDSNQNKKITYIYNATGEKVQKNVITPTSTPNTNYLDGFQYYKNELQFFATSEGYVSATSVGANTYEFNYVYQYKDHLGNVRLNYARDPQTDELKILEENHYYPYGMKHGNYNSNLNAFKKDTSGQVVISNNGLAIDLINKYKFNGIEYQDELGLNLYDMDMRDYDPAIGRWTGIDPVTHFDQSPYCAFNNNPVYFADPSGADGVGGETYTSVFGMQVSTPNNTGMITGYSAGATFGSLYENVGAAWGDGGIVPYFSIDRFDRANLDSFLHNLDHPSTNATATAGNISEGQVLSGDGEQQKQTSWTKGIVQLMNNAEIGHNYNSQELVNMGVPENFASKIKSFTLKDKKGNAEISWSNSVMKGLALAKLNPFGKRSDLDIKQQTAIYNIIIIKGGWVKFSSNALEFNYAPGKKSNYFYIMQQTNTISNSPTSTHRWGL